MNYYIPFTNPYATTTPVKTGLLSKIFKNGMNWGNILTNTQKTLNIINQTIPVIKQVGPVINNAKTMFKVMNEFKKIESNPKQSNNKQNNNVKKENNETKKVEIKETQTNNPTFFL